ncbi:MFS transporter [Shinella zoogloeoides]
MKNLLISLSLYLAGVGAAAQVSKMVASQNALMAQFDMSASAVTIFITLIGLVSILLGSAAGNIVSRIGLSRALTWACMVSMFIAMSLPMISHATLAFCARIIEGVGHLAIVTAAPALMNKCVDKRFKPFMMGLWSTFFGVAFALSFAAYPYFGANGHELFQQLHAFYFLPAAAVLILTSSSPREASQSNLTTRMIPNFKELPKVLLSSSFMVHVGINTSMLVFASRMLDNFTGSPPGANQNVLALYPLISLGASFAGAYFIGRFGAYLAMMVSAAFGLVLSLTTILAPAYGVFFLGGLFCAVGVLQAALFSQIQDIGRSDADIAELNGMFAQFGNFGNLWVPYTLSVIVIHSGIDWLISLFGLAFALLIVLQLHPALRTARMSRAKLAAG